MAARSLRTGRGGPPRPPSDAAGVDLACFGHIHKPQRLSSTTSAYYCGSVNQLTFNDEGDPLMASGCTSFQTGTGAWPRSSSAPRSEYTGR